MDDSGLRPRAPIRVILVDAAKIENPIARLRIDCDAISHAARSETIIAGHCN
jgi:hypothetical protein